MGNSPELVIVDGSALTRKIVEVSARREGLTCIGFPDGEAALRHLQQEPGWLPRLILVEVDLPGRMKGYTVVRLLRVCTRLDRTAIVMFSGHSDLVSRLRAARAGADTCLTKPFQRRAFLSLLSRYCTDEREAPAGENDEQNTSFHAGAAPQNGNGYPGAVPAYHPGR
jgi:DNA-binding response OmpR family regulator